MEGRAAGAQGTEEVPRKVLQGDEVLQDFMLYPHPLAIVDDGAAVMMANNAWRTRQCRAGGVPGGLPAIDGRPGDMDALRERVQELERMAATDHLTGAWNRAHFDRLIDAEIERCTAIRQLVSIVLLDIDRFKDINDTHGHHVGDIVLSQLVRLLRENVRGSDFVFRWGGEEFAVLAPNTGYRGAERLAQTLRLAVAAHPFERAGAVTVSLGVAEHCGAEDSASWFERLDAALYTAKREGRNRVVVDRRGNSDLWGSQAGVSPLHLQWQEGFESGHVAIDAEHRELFVLANRLIAAGACASPDPGAFHAALDTLLAHIQRHFANEEAVLAEHGYADLKQHARAHRGLLGRALHLRAQIHEGKAALGPVVEFLAQDVVSRHLMAADRAFFPLFAAAG